MVCGTVVVVVVIFVVVVIVVVVVVDVVVVPKVETLAETISGNLDDLMWLSQLLFFRRHFLLSSGTQVTALHPLKDLQR